MKKKIALFGGSFNPIHNQHIEIIKEILNKKFVKQVWIVPCKNHPFDKQLETAEHRIQMIKLATKNLKNIKINKTELHSKSKNYTINTIQKLKNKYSHEFYLLIGSDILHEIKKWHKYKELFKKIKFILFKRKSYPLKKVKGMEIYKKITEKETSISSTEIRQKIKQGKSIKNLVPKEVENYIIKNNLYKK